MPTPVADSVNPPAPSSNGTLTDEFISGLAQGGAWSFGGGPHALTYSFSLPDGAYFTPGGGPWTPELTGAVVRALDAWAHVADISFSESGSGTAFPGSSADLALTLTGGQLQNDFGAAALGFVPDPVFVDELLGLIGISPTDYPNAEGDVFFDNYYSAFSYLYDGGLGFEIMLHELGHALGLKHPSDDGGNGRPMFEDLDIGAYDATRYTVMTAQIALGGSDSFGNAATPMPLDILAIQYIYGPNTGYHLEDNSYAVMQDSAMRALWDAGGTDTLDASSLFFDVALDLQPGALMDIGGGSTVLGLAYDTFLASAVIENATGGWGDDTLIGNAAGNLLDGGGGADTMTGAAGNDVYVVQDTGDSVIEDSLAGDDTVQAGISYVLPADIENLALTGSGALRGTGNALDNQLAGNAGGNLLDGGAGADTMAGGAGNDLYVVNDTGDTVTEAAGAGTDTVQAGVDFVLAANVEDLLLAGSANLHGTGNALNNRILGNGGSNLLDGGAGADRMAGGAGDDIYLVDDAGDVVAEGIAVSALASTASDAAQANGYSSNGSMADGGNHVAFESFASNLVGAPIFAQQVFVKNLQTGAVSIASSTSGGTAGNSNSALASLSADGRFVAFASTADNLAAGDTNANQDVFLKDLQAGALTRVSTDGSGAQGNGYSGGADVSADGRYVAFSSTSSNLVAGDGNGAGDAFVKDLQTGVTALVSTDSGGAQVGASINGVAISADGRYVVFQSSASFVAGDTNNAPDLYRKDLQTGATVLVSSAADGTPASLASNPGYLQLNGSALGGVSGDGRYVAFSSVADNLVAGDSNNQIDVFVKDLQTGTTTRVSTASGGAQANNGSNGCGISADGRYVVFNSIATNLAPDDTDATFDVYVKDLQTGLTALVSAPASGAKESNASFGTSLSADGRSVVFHSFASNLVAGDANATGDVFVAQNPLFDPGGIDAVSAGASHALGDYIEKLTLTGSAGVSGTGNGLANVITGNANGNVLKGNAGNDSLDGGNGNDNLAGNEGNDTLLGGEGNDTLGGGKDNDSLVGGDGNDSMAGLAGNDTLSGDLGFDTLDGGEGNDSLLGGLQQDQLFGGNGNDTLGGGNGFDSLNGGEGNDVLRGALGTDTVTGGAGADRFVFATALDGLLNIDTVTDFTSGTDVIELSAAIFGAFSGQIGNTVGLSANLTYNGGTGVLQYDADGAGGGAGVTFAILGTSIHPAVGSDFLIVA